MRTSAARRRNERISLYADIRNGVVLTRSSKLSERCTHWALAYEQWPSSSALSRRCFIASFICGRLCGTAVVSNVRVAIKHVGFMFNWNQRSHELLWTWLPLLLRMSFANSFIDSRNSVVPCVHVLNLNAVNYDISGMLTLVALILGTSADSWLPH